MTTFNIIDLFRAQARANPAQIALIDKDDSKISFEELDRRIDETAQYFLERGITRGDRVLVFVPMSIDLYRVVLALFRVGATAVFLDEWVSMERMALCCEVAQCKAFIGIWKARALGIFSKALRKIPLWLGVQARQARQMQEFPTVFAEDTALLTFTTGTTGTPKAAKRTHAFLKAQLDALVGKLQPQAGEIDMPALPIVLLINLATGVPSVIADFKASQPQTLQPARLFAQIECHQINRLIASPFVVKALAQYVLDEQLACPLRKIFTGGAPVFPQEAQLYRRAFPKARIEIVYGSTEAEPISSCSAEDCRVGEGLCVGKIDASAEVRIIPISDEPLAMKAEQWADLALPAGAVGEIVVAGAHVLREYFNNEEALRRNKIFIEGKCWHRTGDSGFMKDGKLYLTGRCASLIWYEGKMYAPFVWEHHLQISGVKMGTILLHEGKIMACVEISPAADRKKIEQAILALPAPIHRVIFLPAMPRDLRHHSRVDYQKLQKMIE